MQLARGLLNQSVDHYCLLAASAAAICRKKGVSNYDNDLMFTDCPECRRQFRVRAPQLTAAKGLVKCGFCGAQFNALERLHDSPLSTQALKVPIISGALEGEPQFEIPDTDASEDKPKTGLQDALPATDKIIGKDLKTEGNPSEDEVAPEKQSINGEFPFPEELLEEDTARPGIINRLFWSTGVLFLLLISTAQLAWFNRDVLLSRYPELMPWVEQLCDEIQCQLIRHRDVQAIKLLNRDVREHPSYEKTLLVNATMSNQSSTIQPYPQIQLTLFDTNGKLIAYREFRPEDYLDASIAITSGMMPDDPVHFVLEVTGSTDNAVSFEFRFL